MFSLILYTMVHTVTKREDAMKNLNEYIRTKNFRLKMFGQPCLELPKDKQKIMDYLDSDMSPENVSCDGELSRAEVARKMKFFKSVERELGAYQ